MALWKKAAVVLSSVMGASALSASAEKANTKVTAVSQIEGSEVSGTATFTQEFYSANTQISVDLKGLKPNEKHGFSVKKGSDPKDPGETYNPFAKKHGGPSGVERKVGDLGNVQADDQGHCKDNLSDPFIKLSGPYSVVGRTAAIHEYPDDLGYGRKDYSLTTGGVGNVVAAGLIQ